MAAPIEQIKPLGWTRLIEHSIRVLAGVHLKAWSGSSDHYARLFSLPLLVTRAEGRVQVKTVNTGSVGYLAATSSLAGQSHDLRGVADIKTAVRFVNGQVIPTALAANGDFL